VQNLIRTCSIWRALEVVGDTPTLLVLEASMLRDRRFDQFRRRTGLQKALLSDRLKRLVAAKVMEKRQYSAHPPRDEYVLIEKGRALYWTSLMLLRWELMWGDGRRGGKMQVDLIHKSCGKRFMPVPACGHCRGDVDATLVDWREGPGVGWMAPIYSRRRQQRESSEGTTLFESAAQLMGDRWASLIMRSIFTGITRFDDIGRDTGAATNILAERLAWLTKFGVIKQKQYEASPPRFEYRLSRKGIDYYPVLLMLMQWGDKYYASPEGKPLLLTHKTCGHELDAMVVCSECRAPIEAQDVISEVQVQV
jgi:DNA-binding HxlR family transcriptional regulator